MLPVHYSKGKVNIIIIITGFFIVLDGEMLYFQKPKRPNIIMGLQSIFIQGVSKVWPRLKISETSKCALKKTLDEKALGKQTAQPLCYLDFT